jgi:hypothetical protein
MARRQWPQLPSLCASIPARSIDDARVMLTLIKAPADGLIRKDRSPRPVTTRTPSKPPTSPPSTRTTSGCARRSRILGFEYHYRPEASQRLAPRPSRSTRHCVPWRSQQHDPRYAGVAQERTSATRQPGFRSSTRALFSPELDAGRDAGQRRPEPPCHPLTWCWTTSKTRAPARRARSA